MYDFKNDNLANYRINNSKTLNYAGNFKAQQAICAKRNFFADFIQLACQIALFFAIASIIVLFFANLPQIFEWLTGVVVSVFEFIFKVVEFLFCLVYMAIFFFFAGLFMK